MLVTASRKSDYELLKAQKRLITTPAQVVSPEKRADENVQTVDSSQFSVIYSGVKTANRYVPRPQFKGMF